LAVNLPVFTIVVGWLTRYPRFTNPGGVAPVRNDTTPCVGWVTRYPRFTDPGGFAPIITAINTQNGGQWLSRFTLTVRSVGEYILCSG
ncbi:hypothetical protein ACFL3I_06845, partial [Pseudomonadota bacterium]